MATAVETIEQVDPRPSPAESAVASFLRRELNFCSSLLCDVTRDLRVLLGACEGRGVFTSSLHSLAEHLARLAVPRAWLAGCSQHDTLPQWVEELQSRVQALAEYALPRPLQPPVFCLGVFVHQQAFLASVLIDHAKSYGKALHSLKFDVEVSHR